MSAYILVLALSAAASTKAIDVKTLLTTSDQARGRVDFGLQYRVDVSCTGGEGGPVQLSYLLRSKGGDAVAETLAPEAQKGERIVVNGRLIYQIKKTSKRPVPVTLADRLTGAAAVGDIVATGFADLYDGSIEQEKQGGASVSTYSLKLTAKSFEATYPAVNYWIDKKTQTATKAQMLSQAGAVVQTIEFKYEHKLKQNNKDIVFISGAHFSHPDQGAQSCEVKYGAPELIDVKSEDLKIKALTSN